MVTLSKQLFYQRLSLSANPVVLLLLHVILEQGMAHPILRQQNPSKIAVPFKVNAEEVKDFPLKPIGRLPDIFYRGDVRLFPRKIDLEDDGVALGVRVEMINNLDLVFFRQVDGGQIGENLELHSGLIPEIAPGFDDRLWLNLEIGLKNIALKPAYFLGKTQFGLCEYVLRLHFHAPADSAATLGCFTNQRSRIIFS